MKIIVLGSHQKALTELCQTIRSFLEQQHTILAPLLVENFSDGLYTLAPAPVSSSQFKKALKDAHCVYVVNPDSSIDQSTNEEIKQAHLAKIPIYAMKKPVAEEMNGYISRYILPEKLGEI